MSDDPYVCGCGQRMAKRSSRTDDKFLYRYLVCKACDERRTLIVEPERVVEVVLSPQQIQKEPQDSNPAPR